MRIPKHSAGQCTTEPTVPMYLAKSGSRNPSFPKNKSVGANGIRPEQLGVNVNKKDLVSDALLWLIAQGSSLEAAPTGRDSS
jgi:hypothetical protein